MNKIIIIFLFFITSFYLNAEETKKNLVSASYYLIAFDRYVYSNKISLGFGYQNDSGINEPKRMNYYDPIQKTIFFGSKVTPGISFPEVAVNLKYYPFGNNLYISALGGRASGGVIEITDGSVSYPNFFAQSFDMTLTPRKNYLFAISTGYRYEFDSGFYLGFEYGKGMRQKMDYSLSIELKLSSFIQTGNTVENYLLRKMFFENNPPEATRMVEIFYLFAGCRF